MSAYIVLETKRLRICCYVGCTPPARPLENILNHDTTLKGFESTTRPISTLNSFYSVTYKILLYWYKMLRMANNKTGIYLSTYLYIDLDNSFRYVGFHYPVSYIFRAIRFCLLAP